jgi:hypothetical protein
LRMRNARSVMSSRLPMGVATMYRIPGIAISFQPSAFSSEDS